MNIEILCQKHENMMKNIFKQKIENMMKYYILCAESVLKGTRLNCFRVHANMMQRPGQDEYTNIVNRYGTEQISPKIAKI